MSLATNNHITVSEHESFFEQKRKYIDDYKEHLGDAEYSKHFTRKKSQEMPCFYIRQDDEEKYFVETGYFVGVDWVIENKISIQVEPKLNQKDGERPIELDYNKMLFDAMKHPDVAQYIAHLYQIKWDQPKIEITQKQDLLTPFLMAEFLGVLKQMVRKGLRKGYYRVKENLKSRVKGKILVSENIKHNLSKHKTLNTLCSYDEFGFNTLENRILKKTLGFVKNYLPIYLDRKDIDKQFGQTLNFVSGAFHQVSDQVSFNEIKNIKISSFFKEYKRAIELSKMILQRYGYNPSSAAEEKISTPPYWIDMGVLFELYVLSLLKDAFGSGVRYHESTYGNEIDYLINQGDIKMVVDAKYKTIYNKGDKCNHDDVRQVSGYARLKMVHNIFGYDYSDRKLIDCLIIHPAIQTNKGIENEFDLKEKIVPDKLEKVKHYIGIYKLGVFMPLIEQHG